MTDFQHGDMDRPKQNRRANQDEIVQELTTLVNKHDLAGVAFLIPEVDGNNRGMMVLNAKRTTVIDFLAETISYSQDVLAQLL